MPIATTHDLSWSATTVTKRYSRWERGEPRREWEALGLMHGRCPDLVPRPLDCDLGDTAPFVTMSRLPGAPVETTCPVSTSCLDAIADAITRFHHAYGASELAGRPERQWSPSRCVVDVCDWAVEERAQRPPEDVSRTVLAALDAGTDWITRARPVMTEVSPTPVFGRGDGNLANLLWDGERIRLVDFEDAGVSDLPFELADTAEHLSLWADDTIDTEALLDRFDLGADDRARLADYRRLFGLFWLLMLLPGNRAADRNPEGTLDRQAERLLALL